MKRFLCALLMAGAIPVVAHATPPNVISQSVGVCDYNIPKNCLAPGTGDIQLAPTITVQNASYAAGNSEGGLLTVPAARFVGSTGFVDAMRLKSAGASTNTVWIYGWSKAPASTCTDKSAFVSSAADNNFALPGFPITGTLGGSPGAWDTATYAQFASLTANFDNQDTTPTKNIYLCIVTAGSVTPATTADLSLIIGGVQD